MKPRITVITLGVDDLERAPTSTEPLDSRAKAFFDLQSGLKLAVWNRTSIARDTGLPMSNPSPTECTLGHNVGSKSEVDAVMEKAKQAGALIVKPAYDVLG